MALGERGDFAAIEEAYRPIRGQWEGLEAGGEPLPRDA